MKPLHTSVQIKQKSTSKIEMSSVIKVTSSGPNNCTQFIIYARIYDLSDQTEALHSATQLSYMTRSYR